MNKVKTRSGSFNNVFHNTWLRHRELGLKTPIGFNDKFMRSLYTSILPCTSWDHSESLQAEIPGGVFNLEFSPDGSLLVAACEKRSILMFDPLSRQLIHAVDNAHYDCVNCVRFLDSRVFATCSDDSTVALWDARNLRSRIRTLQGHSNWVKNIEFSQRDGLLVTSGFDGSIYTWDINSYTESGFMYNRVFHTNGLMRTRLNPDASKMIICTTGGYLILIHNLDLKTLKDDLDGFKPNMYRLMQLSQTTIPVAASYTHLFSSKRKTNRIEFVTDFPEGDDAEVVSSLQVHPQGWCVLSRNISNDENSEWTCVHDIQEPAKSTGSTSEDDSEAGGGGGGGGGGASEEEEEDDTLNGGGVEGMFVIDSDSRARVLSAPNQPQSSSDPQYRSYRRWRSGNPSSPFRGFPNINFVERSTELTVTSTDMWEALVAIREARSRRERERFEAERRRNGAEVAGNHEPETRLRIVRMSSGLDVQRGIRLREGVSESHGEGEEDDNTREGSQPSASSSAGALGGEAAAAAIAAEESSQQPSVTSIVIRYRRSNPSLDRRMQHIAAEETRPFEGTSSGRTIVIVGSSSARVQRARQNMPRVKVPKNHRIHQNLPRLSHYIEEPNVGKGFIKELCFSADGRLICSPFGYGVRLLAFSPQCSELSTCVPKDGPIKLYELGTNICHSDIVVSTKFSPRHCLLVSGCLTGRIVWHQPLV